MSPTAHSSSNEPVADDQANPEPMPGRDGALAAPQAGAMLVVLFTLGLIFVLGLVYIAPLPGRLALEVNQPAPTDIFAPEHFSYVSELLTEQDRDRARNNAANLVYDYDGGFVDLQRRTLVAQLTSIDQIRADASLDLDAKHKQVGDLDGIMLSNADISTLIGLADASYGAFRLEALRVFDSLMRNGRIADPGQVESTRAVLSTFFSTALDTPVRLAGAALVAPLLGVNVNLNEAATDVRRDSAANAVSPHVVEVQKGEVILRVGQIADALALEKLEKAGLSNQPVLTAASLGGVGMLALLVVLLMFYIVRFVPELIQRRQQLLLIGLVLVLPELGFRVAFPEHAVWPYLLPVAAASMIIAALMRAHLALVITFILSLMSALFTQGGAEIPAFYFVTGLIGVLAIWRAERMITFITAGVYISLAGFAAAVCMHLVSGLRFDIPNIGVIVFAAAVNGLLCACLTVASFTVLGRLFGITTMLQLLELAHPTQPLLRRLMREAPGTYHHSLVVSNLAERAAELVGADPLLARVGAYYHDIGKVLNPYAFIDNQAGMDNIHDTLDPITSARIIREHVTEGYKMGEKEHLPRRLLNAIAQHHGTTKIAYFYHKALAQDPNVDEALFRYPGPKPQSKETAILMLADSVEAAVRAASQNGGLTAHGAAAASGRRTTIETIISGIVKDRVESGQLDECDITLRDLGRIQQAFAAMLNGIYHPRVDYPPRPADVPAVPAQPELAASDHSPEMDGVLEEVAKIVAAGEPATSTPLIGGERGS